MLVVAVVVVIALPEGRSHRSGAPAPSPSTLPARATVAPSTAPTIESPGAPGQTTAFPPSAGPGFDGEMSALWQGVVSGAVLLARPAFFPEAAYLQVKAISDPAADYVNRLVAQFGADLAAAHALLGPEAGGARLVTVVVPSRYGHWVQPGTCENRVGYYEVPNSRLVYRDSEGQTRSFGIASMISWRGTWYVVHLGAVDRLSAGGVVDDPEVGPGTPAYSSTC